MTEHQNIAPPAAEMSRRHFLVGAAAGGAGLIMGYSVLPLLGRGFAGNALAAGMFAPNLWFTMDPEGITTIHIVKAEMGQHVGTALAQSLAEELEVNWADVRIDYPTADPKFGLWVTGGSWSVNWTYDVLSRAGAAGRITLLETAAKMWNVAPDSLRAAKSVVYHDGSNRQITYAELVKAGVAERSFDEAALKAITLKTTDKHTLVGQPVPALDIPAKTNGSAKYGIDYFVEGMVYGAVVTPPVRYGAKVLSFDDGAAKKIPGYVKAVTLEDPTGTITGWVVALAESYPAAMRAAEAIEVKYDAGKNADVSSESILAEAQRLQADPAAGLPFVLDGDVAAAMKNAAQTVEAAYTTSLNLHFALEPMNAVTEVKDGVYHIYTGNQFQTLGMGLLPAALGVKPEQVAIHPQYLGGGYGRRLDSDYLVASALAAKASGLPVKLIYTREHDTKSDFPRSITYQVMKAAIDDKGTVTGVQHDVIGGWASARQAPAFLVPSVDNKGKLDAFSGNGADFWYTVPNHHVRLIENMVAQSATPPGHLRSVAPGWTFFAVESFVDELAHKTGKDPVAFRLGLLDASGKNAGSAPMSVGGAKRLAAALQAAVDRAGYGQKTLPKGTAMGVACASSQERATPAWTACVAQVAVDAATGEYKVEKLTVVSDVGTAVNPDGVLAQVEGAALWGMSIATMEMGSMKDGAIEQSNFDSYTPLRMADLPEMDVHILSPGYYPVGCGEPATTVVAPAIANAIFNAVGARVRALPITPEAVKAGMKA